MHYTPYYQRNNSPFRIEWRLPSYGRKLYILYYTRLVRTIGSIDGKRLAEASWWNYWVITYHNNISLLKIHIQTGIKRLLKLTSKYFVRRWIGMYLLRSYLQQMNSFIWWYGTIGQVLRLTSVDQGVLKKFKDCQDQLEKNQIVLCKRWKALVTESCFSRFTLR